jgi:NAD(P)-dependent dehydrogenase (short-subunit alcohol dehydrogenase family)
MEIELDVVRKTLDTNVVAALGWVQEADARWMGASGGAIVNISSVSAFGRRRTWARTAQQGGADSPHAEPRAGARARA